MRSKPSAIGIMPGPGMAAVPNGISAAPHVAKAPSSNKETATAISRRRNEAVTA
jgi:hypothetical protein